MAGLLWLAIQAVFRSMGYAFGRMLAYGVIGALAAALYGPVRDWLIKNGHLPPPDLKEQIEEVAPLVPNLMLDMPRLPPWLMKKLPGTIEILHEVNTRDLNS